MANFSYVHLDSYARSRGVIMSINTHQNICDCGESVIDFEDSFQYWDDKDSVLVTAYKINGICKECCILESKLKNEYSLECEKNRRKF